LVGLRRRYFESFVTGRHRLNPPGRLRQSLQVRIEHALWKFPRQILLDRRDDSRRRSENMLVSVPEGMKVGTGAKPSRSWPPNSQLSIGEYDETAREGIEAFLPNDVTDAPHKRVGARFTQAHK